jgi:hypothetical protein
MLFLLGILVGCVFGFILAGLCNAAGKEPEAVSASTIERAA